MNDQEIRIAIAEACPQLFWIHEKQAGNRLFSRVYRSGDHPAEGDKECDPLNDLNAINEAWLTLNVAQRQRFVVHLALVGGGGYWPTSEMLGATARQRAEAYLRTIGKWKD